MISCASSTRQHDDDEASSFSFIDILLHACMHYGHKQSTNCHVEVVGDRAREPVCRSDLKSNGTSETSAPELPRRDRSSQGRLSGLATEHRREHRRAPRQKRGNCSGGARRRWRQARHTTAARIARQPPSRGAGTHARRRISGQRRRQPRRLSPALGGAAGAAEAARAHILRSPPGRKRP